MKKRICIIGSLSCDFDARLMKVAKSLLDSGYEVDIICPWNVKEGLHDDIYYRPIPRPRSFLERPLNYPKIWKMLSDRHYDLYYFDYLDMAPLFTLFKLMKGKPVIYDIRENFPEEILNNRPYIPKFLRPFVSVAVRWGEWVCARTVKNLIVVVDSLEKRFSSNEFNVVKVRNFAAIELENGRQDNYESRPPAVLFTGAHTLGNGSFLFLDIARRIHEVRPAVKFYCTDNFPLGASFKQTFVKTIKKYNLSENVEILPYVVPQSIMSYINMCTVGVIPCLNLLKYIIAIPMKTFEYMAGGIPIVASRQPYLIDFVERNRAGLTADPDFPEQFVASILYLLDNGEEARKMGEQGIKAFREKYNWQREEEKLICFVQQVLMKD